VEAEAQASPDPPAPEVHHYTTSPRLYVKIFVFLVVITSIEVALSYSFDIFGRFTVAMLFVAAAVKFVLVVGFYMHLRYESPVLSRFFGGGLALAAALYAIVLGMFGVLGIVFG
jgi:cytochrome c oxidase subunit 4